MKITAFIITVLISQVSASFFDVFQGAVLSVQTSFGKLISDVVSDVRETVDCTILAVEHFLSLSDDATDRYYEKCKYRSTVPPKVLKNIEVPVALPKLEVSLAVSNEDLRETLPAEIDARVNKTLSKFLERYDLHGRLENVEGLLAKESELLSEVSALVKQQLNKLTCDVESDFRRIEESNPPLSYKSILDKVQLLHHLGQNNQNSTEAEEIHQTISKVLDKLDVISGTDNVSNNSAGNEHVIKNMESNSNDSLKIIGKQYGERKDNNTLHLLKFKDKINQEKEIIDNLTRSEYEILATPRMNSSILSTDIINSTMTEPVFTTESISDQQTAFAAESSQQTHNISNFKQDILMKEFNDSLIFNTSAPVINSSIPDIDSLAESMITTNFSTAIDNVLKDEIDNSQIPTNTERSSPDEFDYSNQSINHLEKKHQHSYSKTNNTDPTTTTNALVTANKTLEENFDEESTKYQTITEIEKVNKTSFADRYVTVNNEDFETTFEPDSNLENSRYFVEGPLIDLFTESSSNTDETIIEQATPQIQTSDEDGNLITTTNSSWESKAATTNHPEVTISVVNVPPTSLDADVDKEESGSMTSNMPPIVSTDQIISTAEANTKIITPTVSSDQDDNNPTYPNEESVTTSYPSTDQEHGFKEDIEESVIAITDTYIPLIDSEVPLASTDQKFGRTTTETNKDSNSTTINTFYPLSANDTTVINKAYVIALTKQFDTTTETDRYQEFNVYNKESVIINTNLTISSTDQEIYIPPAVANDEPTITTTQTPFTPNNLVFDIFSHQSEKESTKTTTDKPITDIVQDIPKTVGSVTKNPKKYTQNYKKMGKEPGKIIEQTAQDSIISTVHTPFTSTDKINTFVDTQTFVKNTAKFSPSYKKSGKQARKTQDDGFTGVEPEIYRTTYNVEEELETFNNKSPILSHDEEGKAPVDLSAFFKKATKYSPIYKKIGKENRKETHETKGTKDVGTEINLPSETPISSDQEINMAENISSDYESFIAGSTKNDLTENKALKDARKIIEDSKRTDVIMQNILKFKKAGRSVFEYAHTDDFESN